eukprot:GDKJ01055728.1.p1 GENE.GDKJ01055728.1~~GDKJ01055728.1.p1  ORF type:complete len:577 (+),score=172.83 GDKJ01055728.1:2-1732(+)
MLRHPHISTMAYNTNSDAAFIKISPESLEHKFKVLVSDPCANEGLDILRQVATVDVKTKLTEDELCAIIDDYDALMIRSGTTVTRKIIEACSERMKIIGRAGVGVDNVDVPAATEKGIFVVNSPAGNTIAAAEHTLALLFASSRMISQADASMRVGKWDRAKFMGSELANKTIGIIGLGQVGGHVAKVALAMGMNILAYDPYINRARAESLSAKVSTLEELLAESDFVTCHVPLVPATKHLINKERLALMKKTARLINCSRGGVVDEIALIEALKEGTLAAAALDVFEVEKAKSLDDPLLNCPNLILTPHLGASTAEAQVNVAIDVARQIVDTFKGDLPAAAVNIPGIRAAQLKEIKPLLTLADDLGRLAAKAARGAVTKVTVTLEGDYAKVGADSADPLVLAATKGVLSASRSTPVSFVNVRATALAAKIQLEHKLDEKKTKSRITVAVQTDLPTDDTNCTVSGTLMDESGRGLLSKFRGVPLWMPLPKVGDTILYSKHEDVPGVLGKLTAIMGHHHLNIGNMHLGRTQIAEGVIDGIALFSLDRPANKTSEEYAAIAKEVEEISEVKESLLFDI